MKLTSAEKLILLMLTDIYKKLSIKDAEIDPDFILSAISTGNTWALSWRYDGLSERNDTLDRIANETSDILDMWSFIERSWKELPSDQKKLVQTSANPFGTDVRFRGFDGNNETAHMSAARFFVENLDQFAEFKGRDFNSHSPSIDAYRRMFAVFEAIRRILGSRLFNADEITQLLLAQRYPQSG